MNISEHFRRSEFACHCGCGFAAVDAELLKVLEDVRCHFNAKVKITSGCRCKSHNSRVGGASKSKHVFGIAADIKVDGTSPVNVAKYLKKKYPKKYGIGVYKSWTHIDVRSNKARWSV